MNVGQPTGLFDSTGVELCVGDWVLYRPGGYAEVIGPMCKGNSEHVLMMLFGISKGLINPLASVSTMVVLDNERGDWVYESCRVVKTDKPKDHKTYEELIAELQKDAED